MEEEYEKTFKDYLYIVIRRKYIIAVSIILFMTASIVVAIVLPPVYRAEGTILIENQHIPTDLVKSTVISLANERIQKTNQKIMTTNNILNIIRKYNLYPKEVKYLSSSELSDLFKENALLELVNVDIIKQGRKNVSTIAFKLFFNHKNKKTSQSVVNELMDSFLSENAKFRINSTKETADFLESVSLKTKDEVQKIEKKIAEYKVNNSDSLPELLSVNLSAISRTESQIQQLYFQEKIVIERKISLQTQLRLMSSTKLEDQENSPIESIEWLNYEYNRLLGKYSSSHPDVRTIQRKIDGFNKGNDGEKTTKSITNPAYLQLKSELRIVNLELDNITKERIILNTKLTKLETNVAQTHQVEQGYYELIGDLDSQKAKYKELRSKFLEARLSQTLEEEQKGDKFSILEPARLPSKPYKPNRIKIIFMGFVLSIVCGIGVGFMIENIDSSIRGHKELEAIIGIDPIVVIPYIENEEDKERDRKSKINFLVFIFIILIIVIGSIHFLHMKINIVFDKMLHFISML